MADYVLLRSDLREMLCYDEGSVVKLAAYFQWSSNLSLIPTIEGDISYT